MWARALEHHRRQRAIAAAGVLAGRQQIKQAPRDVTALAQVLGRYQFASAAMASRTMATEAGRDPYVDPMGFVGTNNIGLPITAPLQTVVDNLAAKMEANLGVLELNMLAQADLIFANEITDAGRGASAVEIALEPAWDNYVRILRPPSCSRCAILAGRIYRDNEGFKRHPECDCEHWPVESWEQAHDEGLLFSFEAAFDKGQVTGLSESDARAIREHGAVPHRVVNAAQELRTTSIFGRDGLKTTLASTTRYAEWRRGQPNRPIRLRPESIFDLADGDKDEETRLLDLYGFLKADVDIPTDDGRAGGSGGGGRPPKPAPAGDPEDWPARQAALEGPSFTANGEELTPDEVRFAERMVNGLQHSIAWIPTGSNGTDDLGTLPTNDFTWRNHPEQIEVEHKALAADTPVDLKHVARQIRNAADKNRRRLTVTNVVVDVGDRDLPGGLLQALRARYAGRTGPERLWLMSRGELIQVIGDE